MGSVEIRAGVEEEGEFRNSGMRSSADFDPLIKAAKVLLPLLSVLQ